jgi:hypothetical protein
MVASCNLTPSKPEAVIMVYRDKMRSGRIDQARELLSEQSKLMAQSLDKDYNLAQPAENLSLLNALDPLNMPAPVSVEELRALVQVKTLRGSQRLIRLERKKSGDKWQIDLTEELEAFRTFLEARKALEEIKEQAGEYAASLKAFSDQLQRINVPDQPITQPKKPKRK